MSAKEMNPEQVKSLLRHIDATQSEAVKADIFGQLGYACMYCTNTHEWAALFIGNVQKLLDWVNIEQGSRFWEKLELNDDATILKVTGREVSSCVCAFADEHNSPMALCDYCCRRFQKELFGAIFEKPAETTITESWLKGGRRCNMTVRLG